MQEITQADERNIKCWAKKYKHANALIEDLQQEGRMAMLQAELPEHKYWKMVDAIEQYSTKNKERLPIDNKLRNYSISGTNKSEDGGHRTDILGTEDQNFLNVDNIDQVEFLFRKLEETGNDFNALTPRQKVVIHCFLYQSMSREEIALTHNISRRQVERDINQVINKLRLVAQREGVQQ